MPKSTGRRSSATTRRGNQSGGRPVSPKTPWSPPTDWESLNRNIEACQLCPRLRDHCRQIATEKRRAYRDEDYWGGPVPNFVGPPTRPAAASPSHRPILIVGLAPGAHGANRTGRMFTGDRSGDWLYRALHRAGLATQAHSVGRDDGLELRRTLITAVCHCAPPDNKPMPTEIANCRPFLEQTLILSQPKVILALGQLAWQAIVKLRQQAPGIFEQLPTELPPPAVISPGAFGHGRVVSLGAIMLVGSYHPSQQNTFTKRLTEAMLDDVLAKVVDLAAAAD